MAQMVIIDGEAHKMMSILCQVCQEVKMITSRRGRPPKVCPSCAKEPEKVAMNEAEAYEANRNEAIRKANLRIDNLEMMLKARGTHLSQQPDRQLT